MSCLKQMSDSVQDVPVCVLHARIWQLNRTKTHNMKPVHVMLNINVNIAL